MHTRVIAAKELNDMLALTVALWNAGVLADSMGDPVEMERLASDLIELTRRQNFAQLIAGGEVLHGWARSAAGDTTEGISWIEDGIRDYRATGSMLDMPFLLALQAEVFHLAGRTGEALEAASDAEALVERWTPRISTYVDYQGQLGRSNYEANGVTGTTSFSLSGGMGGGNVHQAYP
jgi:hypothetical protein